jgi:hypothetical protein
VGNTALTMNFQAVQLAFKCGDFAKGSVKNNTVTVSYGNGGRVVPQYSKRLSPSSRMDLAAFSPTWQTIPLITDLLLLAELEVGCFAPRSMAKL